MSNTRPRTLSIGALAVRAIAFDADGDVEFALPDDLTALSDAELESLARHAQELFDSFRASNPRLSKADVDNVLTPLASAKVACREELTRRVSASAEADAAAEALAAAMNPDPDDAENSDAEAEDQEPEEQDEPAEPVAEPQAIAASAKPKAQVLRIPAGNVRGNAAVTRGPAAQRAIAEYARAAARLNGHAPGAPLTFADMGAIYQRFEESAPRAAIANAGRSGNAFSQRSPIASIRIPHARHATIESDDPEIVETAIRRATDESYLPGGSLTASGGWCSVSETIYTMCALESADGLLSLPTLNPRRGGLRNTLGPDWATLLTSTGFCFSEAQDIAGAYGDNETWTLTEGGSGLTSWTLTWNGSTTGSLDDDVVAADVQTAMNNLTSAIQSGTTFTVTGGPLASGAFTVTVAGWNSNTNVPAPTTTPTGGTGVVTVATTNAGGDTASGKPCNTITCPDFTDNRLGVCGVCIQTGILMSRAYPELVERFIRGALTAHMHRVAARHINNIIAGSTAVTVTDGDTNPGAIAPVLSAVELTIESIRNAYRMRDGATMETVFPRWLRGVLRADLSRRLGVDLLSVPNARLDAWFRERSANPQWVYNFDQIGATPTAWPQSVRGLIYPAGTWVALQGDVINLEAVYDSTNLANNNYTSLFTEEATATMKACHPSRVVTIPICPSGATGAGEDLVCAES